MTAPAELTRPFAPATLPEGESTLIDHIAAFATFAVADEEKPDGKTLLKACIAGIESTTRIHFAYDEHMKPYTEMAITPPAIPNAMGSAAAAAIISGTGVDVILPEHSDGFDDYFTPAVVAAYCDLVMQIESEAEVDWLLAPFVGA